MRRNGSSKSLQERRLTPSDQHQTVRRHTTAEQRPPASLKSRHRCATCTRHSRWPACCVLPATGFPSDRARIAGPEDMPRCRVDSLGTRAAQKPCNGTDPDTRTNVLCARLGNARRTAGNVVSGRCCIHCASTSLPWFIDGPREFVSRGVATLELAVQIETRPARQEAIRSRRLRAHRATNVARLCTCEVHSRATSGR